MDKSYIEVKSALWQKIFASVVFLPCLGISVVIWLAPFLPIFKGQPPGIFEGILMGAIFFAAGLALWWPVMNYSIRADQDGIRQTNGFFRQSARWSEVASYYIEPNQRYHKERGLHLEPVLCNAEGAVIFRGFAHVIVSTRHIMAQRRELWQFVEAQLAGKEIPAPDPNLNPEVIALKSLEVKWSEKTWGWKIARCCGLVAYALFWLGLSLWPLYYLVSHNFTVPQPWATLLCMPMLLGPLLPHVIWLEIKKRKIAQELKQRDATK